MNNFEWIDNIGKELKKERKSWAMSRTKLAKLAHIDRETIEEIEQGIIKNPDFFDVLSICDVLDSAFGYFIKKEAK